MFYLYILIVTTVTIVNTLWFISDFSEEPGEPEHIWRRMWIQSEIPHSTVLFAKDMMIISFIQIVLYTMFYDVYWDMTDKVKWAGCDRHQNQMRMCYTEQAPVQSENCRSFPYSYEFMHIERWLTKTPPVSCCIILILSFQCAGKVLGGSIKS